MQQAFTYLQYVYVVQITTACQIRVFGAVKCRRPKATLVLPTKPALQYTQTAWRARLLVVYNQPEHFLLAMQQNWNYKKEKYNH